MTDDTIPYLHPRKVWVEDGHVFVEGHDGATLIMTPEVAISMGRLLSAAGTDSFINKVMDQDANGVSSAAAGT